MKYHSLKSEHTDASTEMIIIEQSEVGRNERHKKVDDGSSEVGQAGEIFTFSSLLNFICKDCIKSVKSDRL
jgi:hypothetical protein